MSNPLSSKRSNELCQQPIYICIYVYIKGKNFNQFLFSKQEKSLDRFSARSKESTLETRMTRLIAPAVNSSSNPAACSFSIKYFEFKGDSNELPANTNGRNDLCFFSNHSVLFSNHGSVIVIPTTVPSRQLHKLGRKNGDGLIEKPWKRGSRSSRLGYAPIR